MNTVDADVLLHDTPGSIVGDCGHLVDLGSYYVRLYLKEGGIPYRFDVCSVECMRRICRKKKPRSGIERLRLAAYLPLQPPWKHVGEEGKIKDSNTTML